MDFLSHLFLPMTAVYVVWRERFDSPWLLGVAGFGLLPDVDKFLGMPGLLHSLVTLVPFCLAVVGFEYLFRGRLAFSPVVVALVGSHLVLDIVDGGPVPLLFPLVETGIGLQYPAQTVFGQGPFGLHLEGPLVSLRTVAPRPENNTYGFIQGTGVAGMLLFGTVYLCDQRRARNPRQDVSTAATATTRHEEDPSDEESTAEH